MSTEAPTLESLLARIEALEEKLGDTEGEIFNLQEDQKELEDDVKTLERQLGDVDLTEMQDQIGDLRSDLNDHVDES